MRSFPALARKRPQGEKSSATTVLSWARIWPASTPPSGLLLLLLFLLVLLVLSCP